MKTILNSVDCVIFGFEESSLKVLLIERRNDPQKGLMALPGDFVKLEEDIDDCAIRTLKDITSLNEIYLEQIGGFGKPNRFPGERVITLGYYALINIKNYELKAGYTAERVEWCDITELPKLAFDHREILDAALEVVRRKIRLEPIGFSLLPEKFSISVLQQLYEAILKQPLNKRNFRTKINQMKLLIETGIKQTNVAHKPAMLYRFDQEIYLKLVKEGWSFNL